LTDQFELRLEQLKQASNIQCLNAIGHGIEKESLRVDPRGHIAQSIHPTGAGSALTHPSITTDFSEALVEFITPVFQNSTDSLAFLSDLHSFFYRQMDKEELLWTSSMPCVLDQEEHIPLAQYGSSNIGQLKTLYRMGLGYRYGRAMQVIAGIHYNFSLPNDFWTLYQNQQRSTLALKDFKTEQYFNLIRNFRRYSWLLIYLFGASPAVCKSFLKNNDNHGLESYDEGTLFTPYGTSLRMGDLGYTSEAQAGLYISYNNLSDYSEGLTQAIKTSYSPYENFSGGSEHKQLNSNILQIENEFYSTIRPKRVAPSGKRPVQVLAEEGVEYIEVRCLDLNPFMPVGIDEEQIAFLNSFLFYCLLQDSPDSNPEEHTEIERNLKATVKFGRDPELSLTRGGENIKLRTWAGEILSGTMQVAALLDSSTGQAEHIEATKAQHNKVENSALTPSAKVMQRMTEMQTPYFIFAMNQSLASSDYFRSLDLSDEKMAELTEISMKSNQAREDIEKNETQDFDSFLKQSNEA
jgi:glutamate--cysteine ligase